MPVGRVLLKSISESKKLAALSTDGARLLYSWLIPHTDINGCFSGDVDVIKGQVFTRLKKTEEEIEGYLEDLRKIGLIIRYQTNGDDFILLPTMAEKQPHLNPEREAAPKIPLPTPAQIEASSRPGPDEVVSGSGPTPDEIALNLKYKSKSNTASRARDRKPRVFPQPSEFDFKAVETLINFISINNPRSKATKLSALEVARWAEEIRRLREVDGQTMDDISKVIAFSQKDSFWKANILTAADVRRKFDRLYAKMTGAADTGRPRHQVSQVGRNTNSGPVPMNLWTKVAQAIAEKFWNNLEHLTPKERVARQPEIEKILNIVSRGFDKLYSKTPAPDDVGTLIREAEKIIRGIQ